MDVFLYFSLVLLLAVCTFWNFGIGDRDISRMTDAAIAMLFAIFTVHIYYVSTKAIDSVNYERSFELANAATWAMNDPLFKLFGKTVRRITDDYQVFRAIIGVIYLLPIFLVLGREKDMNGPLFLMLCLLFPFFQSIVALRFTFASAVAVSTLYLYFRSDQTFKTKILAAAALFTSSLIHDMATLYLVMFIVFLLFKRFNDRRILICALIFMCVATVLALRVGRLSNVLMGYVDETNKFYLEMMSASGKGFLITVFIQLAYFVLLSLAMRKDAGEDGQDDEFEDDVFLINTCALMFLPLYAINIFAFRLFRGLLLLDFIVFCKHFRQWHMDVALVALLMLQISCMLIDAHGTASILSILCAIEWGGYNLKKKRQLQVAHLCIAGGAAA